MRAILIFSNPEEYLSLCLLLNLLQSSKIIQFTELALLDIHFLKKIRYLWHRWILFLFFFVGDICVLGRIFILNCHPIFNGSLDGWCGFCSYRWRQLIIHFLSWC